MSRVGLVIGLGLTLVCSVIMDELVADEAQPLTLTWSLGSDMRVGQARANPNSDREGQACWHFLRTTSSQGPVESRQWLRDGKYTLLTEASEKLFDSPLDGWAYRAERREAPLVGRVADDYEVGLTFRAGDLLVAPGSEHALVIGWRSPVFGMLEVRGSFEHGQTCCGVNSRIKWYVERGLAPDLKQGFSPTLLAAGESDFGTPSQRGTFQLSEQAVKPDDYLYFIVDAAADGTATPHYGDGTRFEVTLTVRDVRRPPPPRFESDILPMLAQKCHDCHGADLQEAKLDLRTLSTILRGGESGPAVVSGDPQMSLLLDLVAKGQMPPDPQNQLTSTELGLLRQWIQAGTPASESPVVLPPHSQITDDDRSYWAFQPPKKRPVPKVRNQELVRTPIDAFLLAKLEERELAFSPEADREILIRRAYFDLLGLPPDPQAVKQFVQDTRTNAYEWMIEELLAAPQYGERWGRHWLDAAGYVDGKLDNDLGTMYPSKGIWRYRDYVIRAFNEDKPFDRFLVEQLAGDELVDWRKASHFDEETLELLTATGFLRHVDDHTDFPQYGIEKRYEVIQETLDMVSTAVLGLTMECCRCHNHKYDPLPQRDYYRLMACFEPAFNVQAWKAPKDRYLADVAPAEKEVIDRDNAELDRQVAECTQREAAVREQVRQRIFASRLAALPEPLRVDTKQALELPAANRDAVQKYLVEKFQPALQVSPAQIDEGLTEPEKAALQASAQERAALAARKKSYGIIQALWDVGSPPTSYVHRRGNVKAPGVLVQPGFPEVLQPPGESASAVSTRTAGESSGRRLALAEWLTNPEHPLTARVYVNRVWHHHFGRGLVETLGNFGRSGSPPTHPELLDWLAVDFREHGWSTKRLHRMMMLSTAYRQVSRRPSETVAPLVAQSHADPAAAANRFASAGTSTESSLHHASGSTLEPRVMALQSGEERDPDNRLLWRMNLRRLEAETVRDAILRSSGALDSTAGGPPIEITSPADGLSQAKSAPTPTSANRRSIYLFARRVYPLKFLEVFDMPIVPVNCTQRTQSTTVLQSLALLNSEFLFVQADQMATRLVAVKEIDRAARIDHAFRMAYARSPSSAEATQSLAFVREQVLSYESAGQMPDQAERSALTDLCHMLLASNEFLYVD